MSTCTNTELRSFDMLNESQCSISEYNNTHCISWILFVDQLKMTRVFLWKIRSKRRSSFWRSNFRPWKLQLNFWENWVLPLQRNYLRSLNSKGSKNGLGMLFKVQHVIWKCEELRPWLTKMGWFVDEIGLNDLMSLASPTTKVQDQLVWLSHNTWNLSNFANTQNSKHAGDQGLSSRCEVSFARDKETWAMNSVRTVGLTRSGPMMFSCYWISSSFKWIDQTYELSNRSATFLIIILPSSTLSKQEMWMHVTFIIYKPWHV